jgi:hypothetical protein
MVTFRCSPVPASNGPDLCRPIPGHKGRGPKLRSCKRVPIAKVDILRLQGTVVDGRLWHASVAPTWCPQDVGSRGHTKKGAPTHRSAKFDWRPRRIPSGRLRPGSPCLATQASSLAPSQGRHATPLLCADESCARALWSSTPAFGFYFLLSIIWRQFKRLRRTSGHDKRRAAGSDQLQSETTTRR